MRPKRAIKELEKQLRKDSENLVLRLKLAAVYREVGRLEDAVALYRSVAVAYHGQGRLVQALAVCRSVLEIDPTQRETQALLEELNRMRQAQAAASQAEAQAVFTAGAAGAAGAGEEEEEEVLPVESSIPSLMARPRRRRPSTGGLARAESSGMQLPLQGPETPPMGSLPPGKREPTPNAEPLAGPGRRKRTSTQRMSQPPKELAHPSASLITPTPLPRPLALHETVGSESAREVRRGPRPLPKNLPHANMDDDAPTRIAPDVLAGGAPSSLSPRVAEPNQLDDELMTTVSDDSGLLPQMQRSHREPPRLPTPPPPLAPREPPRRPALSQRPRPPTTPPTAARPRVPLAPPAPAAPVPPARRVPLAPPLAAPGPLAPAEPPKPRRPKPAPRPKAQPTFFEQETRLVVSMDEDVLLDDDDDADDDVEVPTNPGVDEDALTPPPRGNLFPEEATNPRAGDVVNSSASEVTNPRASANAVTNPRAPQNADRSTDVDMRAGLPAAVRESVDDLSLDKAFDRSFSGTIRSLAPDGAAIDTPLTLFSDLPDEALVEMSNRMVIRSYAAGELVIREGDPGDACFVVAVGEVRVLKRNPIEPHGDLVEVARLGQGALFGEFALLADRRRHATVQAVGRCELYEVPRKLLRELAASFPEVGPVLENFYRERLLATLLATAPFFKPLPEDRRSQLLSRFKPMRAESGERIITEGQRAGGLYLIVLGSVEILKRVSEKRMVLLATLGEGAYFGEMSLLKGGVANASVTATGPAELAVLPPRDFYEIVASNPVLWDEVRREANRRQLEMNQIVTGETNVV